MSIYQEFLGTYWVKIKLPPRSGSSLEEVERNPLKRDHKVFFKKVTKNV